MIKAVLFDIDGVLLDSEDSNREFYRRLLEEFGYKPPSKEEYRKVFHLNMYDAIRALTGEREEEKLRKIYKRGVSYPDYEDEFLKAPQGLRETMGVLSKRYKLGIVTGRTQSGVDELFKFTGLKGLFSTSVCYEDYSKPKPDPESLLITISRLKIKPDEAIYVGDAETDMIAAEKAGINFILYCQSPLLKSKMWTNDFRKLPKIISLISSKRSPFSVS